MINLKEIVTYDFLFLRMQVSIVFVVDRAENRSFCNLRFCMCHL